MNTNQVTNNKESERFEVKLNDGEEAILDYRWRHNNLALMHTFVPPAYEGQGIAASLAKAAFEFAKAGNYKVLVYCPYVSTYIERHPEYKSLVTTNS